MMKLKKSSFLPSTRMVAPEKLVGAGNFWSGLESFGLPWRLFGLAWSVFGRSWRVLVGAGPLMVGKWLFSVLFRGICPRENGIENPHISGVFSNKVGKIDRVWGFFAILG